MGTAQTRFEPRNKVVVGINVSRICRAKTGLVVVEICCGCMSRAYQLRHRYSLSIAFATGFNPEGL